MQPDLFPYLPFALASEEQSAPRAPVVPAYVTPEMFAAAAGFSIAPTALDRANATAARAILLCTKIQDDGLPPCPLCGGALKYDWHGQAACFCNFGGNPPQL